MPFGIYKKKPPRKLYQLTFRDTFQGEPNQFINTLMTIFGELPSGPIGQDNIKGNGSVSMQFGKAIHASGLHFKVGNLLALV